MKVAALDVTEEANATGCAVSRVAVSAGVYGMAESADRALTAATIGAIVRRLIEGKHDRRRRLDDTDVLVETLPHGRRFVVREHVASDRQPTTFILFAFEWVIANANGGIEVDVFHLDRDKVGGEWVQ